MSNIIIGIFLILLGILYQIKPTIFKRWFWTKTSIAQRMFSPEAYEKYMRILGILLILIGIAFCLFEIFGK